MEKMTLFKYVACPVVGSNLIPLKPASDLLMISVELALSEECRSVVTACGIFIILWEIMT